MKKPAVRERPPRRRLRLGVERSSDLSILFNAGSLTGTMAINAALGFVYWWLAARFFAPAAVGLASAAISAMLLLGNAGMLGLGTLLLGILPKSQGHEGELISLGLGSAALAGGVLGVGLALVSPWVAEDLGVLAGGIGHVALFGLGVSLTSAALVLDQALIGLSRGTVQLRRNVTFALGKLILLLLLGIWLGDGSGLIIYATWVAGIVLSFAVITRATPMSLEIRFTRVWTLIRDLGRAAIAHHVLNLVLQAPGLMLPLIVTAILSAEVNAGFYVAWMFVGLVFVPSESLATVLFTASAASPEHLQQRLKRLGLLSFGIVTMANLALWFLGGPILALFGETYAATAIPSLHILALGAFPLIIRSYYVAVRRIEERVKVTAFLMTGGAMLELVAAALGALWGGLLGLCLGWVAALCLQALVLAPRLLRTMRRGPQPAHPSS